eukprot:CAMPEP_0174738162 /NCGR_PEP_ID=MMETSP1094-20130205/69499_1 /TAXON_ID=156173 /ORGANISM="Chrysochromulina brevifilum, Strain UTEX LB 985" /LENGTH=64 /DNA_ID=CAMNT_0015941519 /DNA_START=274 /DNA_END=465 /DNA_ORIENTATION=+
MRPSSAASNNLAARSASSCSADQRKDLERSDASTLWLAAASSSALTASALALSALALSALALSI